MRVILSPGLASSEQVIAGKHRYLLRCQIQFHENDRPSAEIHTPPVKDRPSAEFVPTPTWDRFLAQRKTTFEALTQGVVWDFATETERDAVAALAQEAVQELTRTRAAG